MHLVSAVPLLTAPRGASPNIEPGQPRRHRVHRPGIPLL